MMYEHHKQPLLSIQKFFVRMLRHGLLSSALLIISLGIGILGYHFLEELSWIDALVNASMILGDMGPVNLLHTTAGKLFASFYALYSGMIFLIMAGVMLAPVVHRFLHHFHLMEAQTWCGLMFYWPPISPQSGSISLRVSLPFGAAPDMMIR